MPETQFAAEIDRLAEVAIKVGVRLTKGQDLIVTSPIAALPLARRIAAEAYKAGAGNVTVLLNDEEIVLARYRHGSDASFDRAADWLYEGMGKAYGANTARLAIVGDNPMALSGEDPQKVARANRANSQAYKPALERISGFDINWSIVSYPTAAWAKVVFPDDNEEMAVAKLAHAVFAASRVDTDDPLGAWAAHNAILREKADWLDGENFAALHFTGPGTDLRIGLAEDHHWAGGEATAKNGVTCNANIPTEEVFTTPHAHKVDGTVSATKPLSHQGTLIENISVRFEAGRIVEAHASRGEDVLNRLIDTDEGARRLGEVALVPHSSPISQSGILFYNTLYDENAACHIALGQCYAKAFRNGTSMTPEDIRARGGNSSLIHVDWMIGSDKVDIDGIKQDGSRVPVFRKGEWA